MMRWCTGTEGCAASDVHGTAVKVHLPAQLAHLPDQQNLLVSGNLKSCTSRSLASRL